MIAEDTLRVWAVCAAKPGLLTRCIGVSQFIDPNPRRVVVRHGAVFWRRNRFSAAGASRTPPEIVISCHDIAAGHVGRIAAACKPRPFTVHLGSPPKGSGGLFDLAFVPRHEWSEAAGAASSIRPMVGVPHEITPEMLAGLRSAARTRWVPGGGRAVAVQVDTGEGVYALDEAATARLVAAISSLAEQGWTVLVHAGRRMAAELHDLSRLPVAERIVAWDGSGEDPRRDFLAAADAHVIAKGSIPVCCEALASGRPVFVFDLPQGREPGWESAERFYRDICETLKLARPYEGAIHDYEYPPLEEGKRIAAAILSEIEASRPELIPDPQDPVRLARIAAFAAKHAKRRLSRSQVLPGFGAARRAHHNWLKAQGLLDRPWFILGAAPDPAIPTGLPPNTAFVHVRFSGRSARRHGLPIGDLTLLPRWKEAQRSSGLDFKAILRLRDAPTLRERLRRLLHFSKQAEAEITTSERDDYIIATLGSLFPKVEKRPSNGIALLCFALSHGVENVVLAGISFDSDGYEYDASKRPRRHIDEDRAALAKAAKLFPGVTTTEESLARATGIPLHQPEAINARQADGL